MFGNKEKNEKKDKKKKKNNKNNKSNKKNKKVKKRKKEKEQDNSQEGIRLDETFLEAIAPLGNVLFFSDYFRTGLYYGTILTFQPNQGSVDNLRPMWGTDLLPVINDGGGKNMEVVSRLIICMQNRPDKWVKSKIGSSLHVSTGETEDARVNRQGIGLLKGKQRLKDIATISDEYANQEASYLDVTYKIILYALSKEDLDIATRLLKNNYKGIFHAVDLTKYIGQQQQEFEQLLGPAIDKIGSHDNFTSVEWAGAYPFYSNGWRDPKGDYIGFTYRDIHYTPVFWDSTDYKKLMMIGSNHKRHVMGTGFKDGYGDEFAASAWSTFVTQSELLEGRTVYEISLANEKLTDIRIGEDINEVTLNIDMDSEEDSINMLQAFGSADDELNLFGVLINKIALIFSQLNTDLKPKQIAYFKKLLKSFYISQGLWDQNPDEHRENLRLVQIRDYSQIPTLSHLIVYLKQAHDLLAKGRPGVMPDINAANTVEELLIVAEELMGTYGYLFNKTTTLDLTDFESYPRKVFSLGKLTQFGPDVVMVQFLNTFSFISNFMKKGDTLHITGADLIPERLWPYIEQQIRHMWDKGIKVVLAFNNCGTMVNNDLFEEANVVINGIMTPTQLETYRKRIRKDFPETVTKTLTSDDDRVYFLRKGMSTVMFSWDAKFLN